MKRRQRREVARYASGVFASAGTFCTVAITMVHPGLPQGLLCAASVGSWLTAVALTRKAVAL